MRIASLAPWSFVLGIAGLFPPPCLSQQQESLPRFGLGVKASTLGIGVEAATAVTRHSNVRAGFNAFTYSRDFDKDGITYDARLQLRSFEILYDQYIVGGLHISPGILAYNGNKGLGNASVPGGQAFSLGDVTYFSSRANPVTGSGTLDVGKAAPMLLIGVGNLLPRSQRHFAVNFEAGVVFEGSPKTTLNFGGSTCADALGAFCQSIAGNPTVQANIQSEQQKLNKTLEPFKYYPIVSIGFGYRF